MFKKISKLLLMVLVSVLPNVTTIAHAAGTASPEQVVAEFQKVPYYEMFCMDQLWENAEPDKVGEKFKKYFSKEFYKWFMWVQCGQPATPPNTWKDDQGGEHRLWVWDMRFGFYMERLNGSETWESNVRTESAKQKSPRKAIVKVLYDSTPDELKDIVTTYTLIREDGQWKIDDIAPEGYCSSDCVLAGVKSVKAEMKVRYRRTEKELMENAKKGAVPKPYEGPDSYLRGDYAAALKEIQPLADSGNAEAENTLGVMYLKGQGVQKNEAEAVRWYRRSADQGWALAQFNLGLAYANGNSVAQDYAEAMKWYRKAADQGLANAQLNLGVMYDNGTGVAKNEAEAVKWFRRAADQGNVSAQFNLGVMYSNGTGVAKDEAEAVKWYRRAADQGYASAQSNLGVAYEKGRGILQNSSEAVKWYRRAADQGDATAEYNLGVRYNTGTGVAKDEAEAMKWFRRAADQGDASAQSNLGFMYSNGTGVAKDEAEAVKWYRRAADHGGTP